LKRFEVALWVFILNLPSLCFFGIAKLLSRKSYGTDFQGP